MKDMNGIKYIEIGNKSGKDIVFVHGFPFDHTMWDHQAAYFSDQHNVVLYDVRGLGESEVGSGQFTMETFVDDLNNLINYLELEKPVICGLSMGGYIALRYAEKYGNHGALVLCDTKAEADNDVAKLNRANGIAAIKSSGLTSFVEGFIPGLLAEENQEREDLLKVDLINRSSGFEPEGVIGSLLAMISRTDTTEFLASIKNPVLVVCGEEDKFTPVPLMSVMAGRIKNAKFEVIEGAGHIPPLETPDKFNKVLNDFIATL